MKHIKLISLFAVVIFALSCVLFLSKVKGDVVKSKYFNYVERGARVVKTSPSTQYKLMETYPQSTVTVYNAGTTDLASLWIDRDGLIIKANPFTADVDSFYYFYVDCGKYDIKFSGTGISIPYTYGDVAVCGSQGSGSGNVETLGGTTNFITKFTSSTSIGDSSLYNPSDIQASSTILFGWTSGLATASLDIAIGRNASGKLEINSGVLNDLADLTLHRIEPIPTSTIPGLNFGIIANDPSAPVEGDCWYNTSLDKFRCFENGTTVNMINIGSGITSINSLIAPTQFLVVGTSGTDFNIVSAVDTHTFNLPDASLTARGVVTTSAQTFNGDKTFDDNVLITSNIVNSFLYSDSTKAVQTSTAPTNGQLLIGSTGLAPAVAAITGTSPIAITNGAGTINVSCPTCLSSSTAPAPPQFAVQYNNPLGTFAGSDKFLFTPSNTRLTIGNDVPSTHGNIRLYRGEGSGAYLDMGWGNAEFDITSSTGDILVNGVTYVYVNNKWRFDQSGGLIPFYSNGGGIIGDSGHAVLSLRMFKTIQFDNVNDAGVSEPFINHVRTWNDTCAGCITYTNFISNITDTSSNAASLLMDLQVGGVSKFKIRKDGTVTIAGSLNVSSNCYASGVCDFFGSGTPEGAVTANVGSTYRNTSGGVGTSFYVKESGSGNTGWIAK